MNSKNSIKIGVIAALVGLVAGLAVAPGLGKASIFDSITDFFQQTFRAATSTPGEIKEIKPVAPYEPSVSYESAVIEAVEKARDSVVSIVITKDIPKIEIYDPFSDLPPEFREFFGGGFQFRRPSDETEKKEIGGGTGFIVSPDGLIVTNKHVVLDEDAEYSVLTNSGERYDAKVLARDPVQDIALLKINASGLSPAKLGDSDTLKLGQTVIAIGNALGEFRNTVSVGVVSGLSRSITASGAGGFVERIENVIQTDAAINKGNSGGPLLNLRGEVIGMNTAMAENAQSIGFALPINLVKKDIDSVKKTGTIKVAFLGVRYQMITPELAKEQNLPVDYGALVRGSAEGPAVFPDSPAQKAGLQAEDIIIELNGEKINLEHTLGYLIQKYQIGDTVNIKVLRNGEEITLKATLAERPDL